MKHCFIINPAAGKKLDTNQLIKDINAAAEAENITPEIYITTESGDATRHAFEIASKISGEPIRFYACGGDGTLNEVLNAAVNFPNTEIAVVPVGTGNDYIKIFSNPNFFLDIQRQIKGKAKKADLLKFNGKYCINVLNIGFDCAVVKKVSEIKTKPLVPPGLAYIIGVISVFCKKFGDYFRISLDDEELSGEFTLAVFGKGSYYGNGFKSLPASKADDGYIDACVIEKVSRMTFLKLIGKYKKGLHKEKENEYPFLKYRKCRKIKFESEKPVGICADGEITLEKSIEIEIAPKAISFSVPDGSQFLTLSTENETKEKNFEYFEYQEV